MAKLFIDGKEVEVKYEVNVNLPECTYRLYCLDIRSDGGESYRSSKFHCSSVYKVVGRIIKHYPIAIIPLYYTVIFELSDTDKINELGELTL